TIESSGWSLIRMMSLGVSLGLRISDQLEDALDAVVPFEDAALDWPQLLFTARSSPDILDSTLISSGSLTVKNCLKRVLVLTVARRSVSWVFRSLWVWLARMAPTPKLRACSRITLKFSPAMRWNSSITT